MPAETRSALAGSVRGPAGQWPLVVTLVGMAVGLAVALLVAWRPGGVLIGIAVLVAAVERLVLADRLAGLLQVRSRAFDVTALTTMGFGIVVSALVIAEAPG